MESLLLRVTGKREEAGSHSLTLSHLTVGPQSKVSHTKGTSEFPFYSTIRAKLPSALSTWDWSSNSSGQGGRELSWTHKVESFSGWASDSSGSGSSELWPICGRAVALAGVDQHPLLEEGVKRDDSRVTDAKFSLKCPKTWRKEEETQKVGWTKVFK